MSSSLSTGDPFSQSSFDLLGELIQGIKTGGIGSQPLVRKSEIALCHCRGRKQHVINYFLICRIQPQHGQQARQLLPAIYPPMRGMSRLQLSGLASDQEVYFNPSIDRHAAVIRPMSSFRRQRPGNMCCVFRQNSGPCVPAIDPAEVALGNIANERESVP